MVTPLCYVLCCSAIMRLSNELVYDGALKCGSDSIASATLTLPCTDELQDCPEWLQTALSAQPGDEVIFCNTQQARLHHFISIVSGFTETFLVTLWTICPTKLKITAKPEFSLDILLDDARACCQTFSKIVRHYQRILGSL